MYQAKIINNTIETIINAVSTNPAAPRLSTGTIKQGINTINNFTFDISPNNPGYNSIKSLTTLIEVLNVITNKLSFKGRVLLPVEKMNSDGKFSKNVVCEDELGYLMDSVQRYGEYHDITVRDFLQIIIDTHNSQVDDYKKFQLGIVEISESDNSLYRYLDYDKTLDTIKDKLISRLGGELRIRWEDGIRYLDYLTSIGESKDTEIRLAKNIKELTKEENPCEIITRLIPLGAKLEDTDERLTIKSVNNNIDYIDDSNAIAAFGIIVDKIIWDDVTLAENLLAKATAKLQEVNKIKKKHSISALDLSLIGLDIDSFEVGNTHPIINQIMNIDERLRIIEKNIDILNPQNSDLTIDDTFEDIKQYQLKISQNTKLISGLAANISGNINKINNTNIQLNATTEQLNITNTAVTELTTDFSTLKIRHFMEV